MANFALSDMTTVSQHTAVGDKYSESREKAAASRLAVVKRREKAKAPPSVDLRTSGITFAAALDDRETLRALQNTEYDDQKS